MIRGRRRLAAGLLAVLLAASVASGGTSTPAGAGPADRGHVTVVPLPAALRPAMFMALEAPAVRSRTVILPLPSGELAAAVKAFRDRYGIPGLQVAILWADGRSWTARGGFSDVAGRARPTEGTSFSVGSVTKTFVATLILQLVEAGRFSLDDRVAPLLPGVTVGRKPIDPRITVRHLLSHTSGLDDYFSNPTIDRALIAAKATAWSPTRTLAYVRRPDFEPGAGWSYSNTNFVLLGLLAERTTGRPLAELLRSRFFDPLGLTSTFLQGAEPPVGPVAHAYRFASRSASATPIDLADGSGLAPFTSVVTAAGAAGAVASSAVDLVHWARALYAGSVLPPTLLAAMEDPTTATGGRTDLYGLGMRRNVIGGSLALGHSGRLAGAWVSMRYFPAYGFAIAVTTNQYRTNPERLVATLVPLAARVVWNPSGPGAGPEATTGTAAGLLR